MITEVRITLTSSAMVLTGRYEGAFWGVGHVLHRDLPVFHVCTHTETFIKLFIEYLCPLPHVS